MGVLADSLDRKESRKIYRWRKEIKLPLRKTCLTSAENHRESMTGIKTKFLQFMIVEGFQNRKRIRIWNRWVKSLVLKCEA